MFQITLSVDSGRAGWLYSLDDVIRNQLNSCVAVSALRQRGQRLYCSFGCENSTRDRLTAAVKECLIETFGVVSKFDFIKKNLMLGLPQLNYEILVHTLVAFDRENEHKLLDKVLTVKDGMALDGIFDFKLAELKDRWLEICDLTRNNGAYLFDDDTYNELLRFLISAVNPKINKLTLCENNGKYRLTGSLKNSILDIDVGNSSELMYRIIDLAPLELVIDGGISNRNLTDRLVGIFDAKLLPIKNKSGVIPRGKPRPL